MGGAPGTPPGSVPGASIQKLINIDRLKTGRNFGINLKEVIVRFIWTYLSYFFNTFLPVLYSSRQPMR